MAKSGSARNAQHLALFVWSVIFHATQRSVDWDCRNGHMAPPNGWCNSVQLCAMMCNWWMFWMFAFGIPVKVRGHATHDIPISEPTATLQSWAADWRICSAAFRARPARSSHWRTGNHGEVVFSQWGYEAYNCLDMNSYQLQSVSSESHQSLFHVIQLFLISSCHAVVSSILRHPLPRCCAQIWLELCGLGHRDAQHHSLQYLAIIA